MSDESMDKLVLGLIALDKALKAAVSSMDQVIRLAREQEEQCAKMNPIVRAWLMDKTTENPNGSEQS